MDKLIKVFQWKIKQRLIEMKKDKQNIISLTSDQISYSLIQNIIIAMIMYNRIFKHFEKYSSQWLTKTWFEKYHYVLD